MEQYEKYKNITETMINVVGLFITEKNIDTNNRSINT